jgi:hypothetical protein
MPRSHYRAGSEPNEHVTHAARGRPGAIEGGALSVLLRARNRTVAVAALTVLFFAQSFFASRQKSATYDEPVHIAAGLSYVATGTIVAGPEHPPLLKELSGLALRVSGVQWPVNESARALLGGDLARAQEVGNALLADNGPDRILGAARLPLILLSSALVVLVYAFALRVAGPTAGLCAAFVCALDPTFLAHSYLVTTDAGITVFATAFMVVLWDALHSQRLMMFTAAGVALGSALAAKYSAVILPPLAIVLTAFWIIRDGRVDRQRLWRYAAGITLVAIAAFVVLQIVYVLPRNPLQYVAGWRGIYGGHVEGFQAYFAGKLAPRFYGYYLYAIALKAPLALIAAAVVGLGVTIIRRVPIRERAFLLLPPSAFLAGYSLMSFNIGIRYMLPLMPFVYVLAGIGLAAMATRWKGAVVSAALCAWLVVAAAGIYPDHLSYFNEVACASTPRDIGLDGGSRCGPRWLDDSNVDWGQGLKQLRQWVDAHARGSTLRLGYFGTVPPQLYGIDYVPMSDADLLRGAEAGIYAVSAHIVASTPAVARRGAGSGAEWLRATKPSAIVGHAYYIFERQ